ncbi:MAG: sulfite exporter TauE/SafE family protein [Proteobacteria bacterium]|nr:sulfite exporter TauE/SafE family protein [Pseudomonadota bacterium]
MTTTLWILIGATFLLAGLVKGVIGMGLPTVAMGVLAVVLPPAEAAALLVVPSLVTNVWQLLAGPSFGALARRLWPMMVAILVGTIAGAGVLASDRAGLAGIGLGLALVVYAALGLAGFRMVVAQRHEAWLGPVVGLTTGLVTGATGVLVIPAVPYLQALELERDDLIQALGLSFTVSTVALALGLLRVDAWHTGSIWLSLLALVPALIGMQAGQMLRQRIAAAAFRRVFFVGLLLLGIYLVVERLA